MSDSPKLLYERDNLDLLELVCELVSRFTANPNESMHNRYWDARRELEKRLVGRGAGPVQETITMLASKKVFNIVGALPNTPTLKEASLSAMRVSLSEVFPLTMSDGTIVHGCMIGASNGSIVWLVDSPFDKKGKPDG
jgi:hypothetical protein